MSWDYIIDKGILCENPNIELLFDTKRELIRNLLSYNSHVNVGRFESEDSYKDLFNISNNYLRLHFKDELLSEIEVLNGTIIFDNIIITTHTDLALILNQLELKGYHFKETFYSYFDPVSKIDLGDSEKNGGISNLVYWILIAEDFDDVE